MKDEIKEILDKPKILMLSYGNYISLNDYLKLKDCITNLQEENERLKQKVQTLINQVKKLNLEAQKYFDLLMEKGLESKGE